MKAAKKERASLPDGETQLLQVLLQRHESRAAGLLLDPGLFEDSVHRAIFDAWVLDALLAERPETLDGEIRERYDELAEAPLPDYDPRHVGDMVTAMGRELRTRRQATRLLAVARDQAEAVRNARKTDGVEITGSEGAVPVAVRGEVADEFEETVRRQRELTRTYQVAAGLRAHGDEDPSERGGA